MFKTFWNWLVVSSADEDKLSLTLKGIFGAAVTTLTVVLGFANIHVGDLTPVVDALITLIQAIAAVVSAVVTLYGLVRKVVLTITGEHAGLQ